MTPWTPHPLAVRLYISRWPTLRTVRITGSGEVWVDETRRRGHVDGFVAWILPGILNVVRRMADAMEAVR